MKRRVVIKKSPTYARGGSINNTAQEVPLDNANIVAELGETVLGDLDGDGNLEHMNIAGEKHSAGTRKGGTPLKVPEGSFIFSDKRNMKIGGDILDNFGKNGSGSKKYTPADIAKQYKLNDYERILRDPNVDKATKETAQMMVDKYNKKLGELALVQEQMKGFPDGIPAIAMPLLQSQEQGVPGGTGTPGTPPMAAYGGSIPHFGPGGSYRGDPNRRMPVYDKWLTDKARDLNNQHVRLGMRSYRNNEEDGETLPAMQHKRQDGTYGEAQWDLDQFEKDHSWFFDSYDKRNTDPRRVTTDFQNAYNKKYRQQFGHDYFYGQGHTAVDGKFGEYTYNAPVLKKDPTAQIVPRINRDPNAPPDIHPVYNEPVLDVEHPADRQQDRIPPGDFNPQAGTQRPNKWWTQDKNNFGESVMNRFNLRKYGPMLSEVNPVLPDPTFYDPTRELAAGQEGANAQTMANSMFAGPQRGRAIGSGIQGQELANAANVLGRYNNLNVGVANQFAPMRAEIQNNANVMNVNGRQQYHQGWATTNQQYDNSVAQANMVMGKMLNQGITNSETTGWLNGMYPQYAVDPSNGYIDFTKGRNFDRSRAAAGAGSDQTDPYMQWYNFYLKQGLSDTRAHDVALKQVSGKTVSEYDQYNQQQGYKQTTPYGAAMVGPLAGIPH